MGKGKGPGQGMNLMVESAIRQSKPLPSFAGSSVHEVRLTLEGSVQDPTFVRFLEHLGEERLRHFSTYDFLALRYARAQLSFSKTAFTSFIAFAFSNTLGWPVFTGSAVRYRLFTGWGVSASETARAIAFSSATFWIGVVTIAGFGMVGRVKAGKMTADQAEQLLPDMVCGAGACVGLYTANTMAVVTEALGMSLTRCATTTALDPQKKQQAYKSGLRIVELVKADVRPRSIMTRNAFENAIRVDMSMGGSTNTVLHIPAIAREAGIDIEVDEFDRISRQTPNLCSIIPAGPYEMADIDAAGGIPAVLKRLQPLLRENPTVNGKSIIKVAEEATIKDPEAIRSPDRPFHAEGGIAVLRGNIAESAVVKQTAIAPDMLACTGPARVFYTEEALLDAIAAGKIAEGDVVVLPFQGPAGGPGMPEMLTPTDAIKGAGFTRVALITDGRFSGATSGLSIGHVEMEAYNGGAIAAIRDGDIIDIDVTARKLDVRLSPAQIRDRLSAVDVPERKLPRMLATFRKAYTGINCYGKQA